MDEKNGMTGLIEGFADLPDGRVKGRTDHDLLDIVVLALCAVMSGAEAWLRRYLPLRNGIPGHDRAAWPRATPSGVSLNRSRQWNWNDALEPGWLEFARR